MPFCPKCRSEFNKGITKCSDCNIDLVDVLPVEENTDDVVFDKLVHVSNEIELSYIVSLLEDAKILYRTTGGVMGDIMDFSYGKVTPKREIYVEKDKMDEAMAIVLSIAGETVDEHKKNE